jgi:hypothetical protein
LHYVIEQQKSFLTGKTKCNVKNHQHFLSKELSTIQPEGLHQTNNNIINKHNSIDEISAGPKVA